MSVIKDLPEVGVIAGRFQTPRLTEGHKTLIYQVMQRHPRVLVFIGNTPLKGTANDPLTFSMRRAVIEREFPAVEVHRIDDVFNAKRWNRELDRSISVLIGPTQKAVLYGSRKSFLKTYDGRYPTEELPEIPGVSASAVRYQVGIKPKFTEDFLEGATWQAQNQFPKVHPTVDMAVLDKGQVLLVRKPNESLWRFPGGFADPKSPSFEDDAIRELDEETTLTATGIEYIGSSFIEDPRYISQRDKIKTTFFAITSFNGTATPMDDLRGGVVHWATIHNFDDINLMPFHVCLWQMLRRWVQKKS